MARVLKGSHSFTCTPRVHPLTEWTIPAFAFPLPAEAGTHLPTPEGWKAELALGGWLVTYWNRCPAPGIEPDTVTYLSTKRVRRRLTSLIKATTPDHQPSHRVVGPRLLHVSCTGSPIVKVHWLCAMLQLPSFAFTQLEDRTGYRLLSEFLQRKFYVMFMWPNVFFSVFFFILWTVYTCNNCWFYVLATCKRLSKPFVVVFYNNN